MDNREDYFEITERLFKDKFQNNYILIKRDKFNVLAKIIGFEFLRKELILEKKGNWITGYKIKSTKDIHIVKSFKVEIISPSMEINNITIKIDTNYRNKTSVIGILNKIQEYKVLSLHSLVFKRHKELGKIKIKS